MFSGCNLFIHKLKNDKLWNGMPKTEHIEYITVGNQL